MKALNAPVVGSGGGGVGPAFRELMSHFVLGTDESCLMASDGGKVKVFADKGKGKYEKILAGSRVSITILRTAATGGATGPTQFLLEGVKVKTGYTANWPERHDAAPGSSIVMTPTASMTEKAWLEIAEMEDEYEEEEE